MSASRPQTGLLAYLDSVLVIAVHKRDLDGVEQSALFELLRLASEGQIALVTSEVTRDELDRYAGDGEVQMAIYNLMRKISLVEEKFETLSPLLPFTHGS